MNRGTWWTTVHWVTKSRTQLSDFYFLTWSLYNVTYQFYLHKIKRKNILKLKWTNKKYKLSSFEKLKENKAYITTQFTLRCNCPQRLLFKSLIGYSLLPFAPQSGCLCVSDDALSCTPIPTPPQSKCWKAELGVALFVNPQVCWVALKWEEPLLKAAGSLFHFEYEKWEEFGSCPSDLQSFLQTLL